MSKQGFDCDTLLYKALQDYISYKAIHEFINNRAAMNSYKSSFSIITTNEELRNESSDSLYENIEEELKGSLSHFASQALISLCTTYEVSAVAFFKALFVCNPKYMHSFVGSNDTKGKGYIRLSDVVDAGDFTEFIDELAYSASKRATKGKYGGILKRACKLCNSDIDENFLKKIDKVQERRNEIIHEKKVGSYSLGEISEVHQTITEAIEILGKLAMSKEVLGAYTYFSENTIELDSFSFLSVGRKSEN